MFINKTGYDHLQYGINNHDYGFEFHNEKMVCDGCGEGLHSEVGVKLFILNYLTAKELFEEKSPHWYLPTIQNIFEKTLKSIVDINYILARRTIQNYMLFTILSIMEFDGIITVSTIGDGYIITQAKDNNIEFIDLDHKEYPDYYAYKYISGIDTPEWNCRVYSKELWKRIGVATDGLRYIIGTDLEPEFKELLIEGKEVKVKRFINKHQKIFKDDITIVF